MTDILLDTTDYDSLDGTGFGRWVQGCPAAEANNPTKGAQVSESRGGDPGLTRPTVAVGDAPTRPRSITEVGADASRKAEVDSENRIADAFANAGYRTVQNPTRGTNPALTRERMAAEGLDPRKNPDLLVENRVWDTYMCRPEIIGASARDHRRFRPTLSETQGCTWAHATRD